MAFGRRDKHVKQEVNFIILDEGLANVINFSQPRRRAELVQLVSFVIHILKCIIQ